MIDRDILLLEFNNLFSMSFTDGLVVDVLKNEFNCPIKARQVYKDDDTVTYVFSITHSKLLDLSIDKKGLEKFVHNELSQRCSMRKIKRIEAL